MSTTSSMVVENGDPQSIVFGPPRYPTPVGPLPPVPAQPPEATRINKITKAIKTKIDATPALSFLPEVNVEKEKKCTITKGFSKPTLSLE